MKHKTILITGATGFLGSSLARELFAAGVHLKLLIRNTVNEHAKERISEVFPRVQATESVSDTLSDRIEIIEGDISQKYLGLSAQNYARLSDTVDEVFHCAAATKFYHGSDTTLIDANVHGTENILWFCLSNKPKRLHYMSTAYVAGTRRDTVYEHELEKRQSFNNHYEKSKFDAEMQLRIFACQHNIPTTIYRPSIIVGDSRTGFTRNYDNIYVFGKGLSRLKEFGMRTSHRETRHRSKCGMDLSMTLRIPGDRHGTINLIPVDYAAKAIVAISRHAHNKNKTFHIVNPSPPTLGELAEWMMITTGFHHIRIVPTYEFQIRAHTIQERYFLQRTEAFQPYLFGEPYFDSTNTMATLRGTAIECPLITQELINLFIQYAVDTQWGKKKHLGNKEQSQKFVDSTIVV